VLVSLPVGLRLDLRFGHFHHTRPSPITFPPIPKGRGTFYIEEVRMRNTRTLTADWRLLSHVQRAGHRPIAALTRRPIPLARKDS
jgi:hypothetical protein